MKPIRLVLFFTLIPFIVFSQIDSVVIHHCIENNSIKYSGVDSFNVDGLLINSTGYLNDSLGLPWNQRLYTYSSTNKLLSIKNNYFQDPVWVRQDDQTWQYNNNDSLILFTVYRYYSGFTIGENEIYSYDSLGRIIEKDVQKFDNLLNAFVNDSRALYLFDALNQTKIIIGQNFVDSLNAWVNHNRITFYTDSFGKRTRWSFETWEPPGVFSFYIDESYYYLPNDSLDFISEIIQSSGDSTVTKYIYDNAGYLSLKLINDWVSGSINETSDSTTYLYDANYNLISSDHYLKVFGFLELCNKSSNSYDSLNRLINYFNTDAGFCGRGGESGRTVYNSLGLIDSLMECKWTMGTSNCSKCAFEYYSLISGITSVINETGFNIFPNPARSEITIYFRQFTQPKTVVFYDNVGRMVKSEKLYSDKNTLSVSELSPGIYFVFLKELIGSPVRIIKI